MTNIFPTRIDLAIETLEVVQPVIPEVVHPVIPEVMHSVIPDVVHPVIPEVVVGNPPLKPRFPTTISGMTAGAVYDKHLTG